MRSDEPREIAEVLTWSLWPSQYHTVASFDEEELPPPPLLSRCVCMGSRVVESAATEDARPDDGSQDDSRSEVDAWGSSEDDEGLDSGARADPLRDKRRPAQGNRGALRRRPGCTVGGEVGVPCQPPPTPPNATTSTRGSLLAAARDTQRPPSRGRRRRDNDRPAPPGTGVQRGGFAVGTRGDLHKSPPGETRSGVCSHSHSPKRCVRHCPRPLAVVKWYRIYADWYKTDTSRPGAVVNKTQPKAPLPREGFGMKISL